MKFNKFTAFIMSILMICNIVLSNSTAFKSISASAETTCEEVVIPVVSDLTDKRLFYGLKYNNALYVTLEDACELTGTKLCYQDNKCFVTERGVVKLFGSLYDNSYLYLHELSYSTVLALNELGYTDTVFKWDGYSLTDVFDIARDYSYTSFTDNNIEPDIRKSDEYHEYNFKLNDSWVCKEYEIYFDTYYYNNQIYVNFSEYMYLFDATVNTISFDDLYNKSNETLNILKVKNTINKEDFKSEMLNTFNLDFEHFDSYYSIENNLKIDNVFLRMKDLPIFSWSSAYNKISSNKADFANKYDAFINDYNNIFDTVIGAYKSDEAYYDTLLDILNVDINKYFTKNDKKDSKSIDYISKDLQLFSNYVNIYEFGLKLAKIGDMGGATTVLSVIAPAINAMSKYEELSSVTNDLEKWKLNLISESILKSETVLSDDAHWEDFWKDIEAFTTRPYSSPVSFLIFYDEYKNTQDYYYSLYDSAKRVDNLIESNKDELKRINTDFLYEEFTNCISDCTLSVLDVTPLAPVSMTLQGMDLFTNILQATKLSQNMSDIDEALQADFISEVLYNDLEDSFSLITMNEHSYYQLLMYLQTLLLAYEKVNIKNDSSINEVCTEIAGVIEDTLTCDKTFFNVSKLKINPDMVDKFNNKLDDFRDDIHNIFSFSNKNEDYSISREKYETIIVPVEPNKPDTPDDYEDFDDIIETGQLGDDVYYELSDSGFLRIYGTGRIYARPKCPFENKNIIKNVTIEDGITELGGFIFWECENIISVNLPDTLTEIGSAAFDDCTSLKSINIPENIICIYSSTFAGCTSLEYITLPGTLKEIWNYAFSNCDNLKEVYYNGTKNDWKNIYIRPYNNNLVDATLHCLDSSEDNDWQNAYAELLKEKYKENSTYKFALAYVNDDDIPELVTMYERNSTYCQSYIYTFYNGEIHLLEGCSSVSGLFLYSERNNLIKTDSLTYSGTSGGLYAINNGDLEVLLRISTFERVAPIQYYVNGESATKSEYNEAKAKYDSNFGKTITKLEYYKDLYTSTEENIDKYIFIL